MADPALKEYLSTKRNNHVSIEVDGIEYKIRDQQPILIDVLKRSLSSNISVSDFIELLNKRVFWWPTLDRLRRHYARYKNESPIIIRVASAAMIELNENAEFCRLNSGATRCHPFYGGNAPTRGSDTFLSADLYLNNIASVAEVTFVDRCSLPNSFWVSSTPEGPWTNRVIG